MRNRRDLYTCIEWNTKRRNVSGIEKQKETHCKLIVGIFLSFPDRPRILELLDLIHGVKAER